MIDFYKKSLSILLFILLLHTLSAETITYSPYTDGDLITADGMNTRFSLVYTLLNGNLDSSNIEDSSIETVDLANDAVDNSKIASDAASLYQVSGGAMSNNGSYIGIGTTTPGTNHLCVKSSGETAKVIIDQDGENNSFLGFSDNETLEWHMGRGESDNSFNISESLVAERILIKPGGYIGINNTNPNVALDVSGDIGYTVSLTKISDSRYKENIENISNPMEIIEAINGVYFNTTGSAEKEVGVLARDVQKTLPEAVSVVDPENETLGVSYTDLVPVLIEAVKILSSENEDLKSRIEALEER